MVLTRDNRPVLTSCPAVTWSLTPDINLDHILSYYVHPSFIVFGFNINLSFSDGHLILQLWPLTYLEFQFAINWADLALDWADFP